jgi:Glycosyl transferase family 2
MGYFRRLASLRLSLRRPPDASATPGDDKVQHATALIDHGKALAAHDQWLAEHGKALAGHGQWLADHNKAFADHSNALDDLRRRLDELERIQSLMVFMEWIEHARLSESPRISVVLPTRNRANFLPMAVASVQAQSYANWELLIVDDGSDDETPERLAALDDPRIRSFRIPHAGSSAARNTALDQATGDIIAYVDDDNVMHPFWLKAVAWAFGQRPNVDVLYGAIILDDVARVDQRGSGSFAKLFFRRYDRKVLLNENLADMGAIAHRARLPGARFDESLVNVVDWDLLCRLTADRDPLVLPAVACFYFTDAPNRLSGGTTRRDADRKTVRRKHAQEGV